MVVGGLEPSNGTGAPWLSVPPDALVIDVTTGESTSVPAPTAGEPMLTLDAVGTRAGFVVIGQTCPEGDRLPPEEPMCETGDPVSLRYEPASEEWQPIVLPDSVRPPHDGEAFTFQPRLATTPDGGAFLVVRSGRAATADEATRLLVLSDDTGTEQALLPSTRIVGACATSEAFYLLTSETSPMQGAAGLPAPVTSGARARGRDSIATFRRDSCNALLPHQMASQFPCSPSAPIRCRPTSLAAARASMLLIEATRSATSFLTQRPEDS